ncbi:MAG TPA: deoxyribonuclease IV [Pirellulaceae bacterium]|jgi:deoxyribonuclease IV|nr:deoxyribonuclease IV [Pirellulaceae bacterium]
MPLLGAHMSIAGGYYRAVDEAHTAGCDCVQLFTKNNNQWRAKPISEDDIAQFRDKLIARNIAHPLSHACYLINLASANRLLWQKSVDAMVIELERAEQLGIPYVVVHPGAAVEATEAAAIKNVVRAIDEIHRRTGKLAAMPLLENTAGQGSCLGWQFAQLAAILDGVKQPQRVGVCFDTCHAFAAGYSLGEREAYQATWREFDSTVGIERLKAIHLNDSKRELGARVDRHEHIGRGKIGTESFRLLLSDARFCSLPMYLETPKGEHEGETWDVINLRVLRGLVSSPSGDRTAPAASPSR